MILAITLASFTACHAQERQQAGRTSELLQKMQANADYRTHVEEADKALLEQLLAHPDFEPYFTSGHAPSLLLMHGVTFSGIHTLLVNDVEVMLVGKAGLKAINPTQYFVLSDFRSGADVAYANVVLHTLDGESLASHIERSVLMSKKLDRWVSESLLTTLSD